MTYFLERLPRSITVAALHPESDVIGPLVAEARRLGEPYRAEWIALERTIDGRGGMGKFVDRPSILLA